MLARPLIHRHNPFVAKLFGWTPVVLLVMAALLSTAASGQTLISITVTQIYDTKGSTQLPVGSNRQFTAYANYSNGTQTYVTQQSTWSSANTSIAQVTPTMGLVTAEGVGTVNITATYQGVQGSSSLTVIDATLPIEAQQQQMRQLVLAKLTQARQLRVAP